MTRVVTEAIVDDDTLAGVLRPREGVVAERATGPGRFEGAEGAAAWRRWVRVEHLPDGRHHVRQQVEFRLRIPYFSWLFLVPFRRWAGALTPPARPWWAPPDRLDGRAAAVLARLAALSAVTVFPGVLLTQTITFAAQEFGADKADQGLALAAVRADVVLALALAAAADRRGRRKLLVWCAALGCAATALGALAPNLAVLAATQILGRGFLAAAGILVAIVSAEEMPSGSRAWAVSLLSVSAGLGAGAALALLPLADLAVWGWRLLFAAALGGVPLVVRFGARLPESRRFHAPHGETRVAGHRGRFWLLAASGFLFALFFTPASQFLNEFLRDERGFSATRITLFTVLTNVPGGIGIVVGGRLADTRGRRAVGAVGVAGGVGATVLMFLATGWTLWAWSVVGAVVGAATVPALGVYGPELFPTGARGRVNGIMTGLGRAGSVVGLVVAGFLAERLGGLGPALGLLAAGPAVVVVLIVTLYPETAHVSLEDLNPEDRPPAGPPGEPPAGGATPPAAPPRPPRRAPRRASG